MYRRGPFFSLVMNHRISNVFDANFLRISCIDVCYVSQSVMNSVSKSVSMPLSEMPTGCRIPRTSPVRVLTSGGSWVRLLGVLLHNIFSLCFNTIIVHLYSMAFDINGIGNGRWSLRKLSRRAETRKTQLFLSLPPISFSIPLLFPYCCYY